MSDAHASHPTELNFLLQDGSKVSLRRDDADRLVVTGWAPVAGKHKDLPVRHDLVLAGFGAWPSWDANSRQNLLTLPDEDSGLFEPERLFVLREQYAFLADAGAYLSLGPIDKGWWTGTEHVVQARQRSGKH